MFRPGNRAQASFHPSLVGNLPQSSAARLTSARRATSADARELPAYPFSFLYRVPVRVRKGAQHILPGHLVPMVCNLARPPGDCKGNSAARVGTRVSVRKAGRLSCHPDGVRQRRTCGGIWPNRATEAGFLSAEFTLSNVEGLLGMRCYPRK